MSVLYVYLCECVCKNVSCFACDMCLCMRHVCGVNVCVCV